MDEKFNIGNSEEIKKCPLKLALFGEYVYKVLEIIAKFDESIIELWDRDFSYKGRDYAEGKE